MIEDTVAHVIGIQEKLDALHRISQGSVDTEDYSILGDDWSIEDRAKLFLDRFGMSYLSLKQTVATLTVLNNFKKFNPALSEFKCRSQLAQLLFRNTMAERCVSDLSGGEKLRVLLACVLMASIPPQLIILDEPTNHLDLESITVMEQALKQYQGALLVISHDEDFLANIGIDKKVDAPFVNAS